MFFLLLFSGVVRLSSPRHDLPVYEMNAAVGCGGAFPIVRDP